MSDSLTIEILKDIREATVKTNHRLEDLGAVLGERIDHMGTRIERLERRNLETEVRLATELVAVATAVHQVRDAILEDRALRGRVGDLEQRVQVLERKTA